MGSLFMDWGYLECDGVVKLGGVRAAVLPAPQFQVLILAGPALHSVRCSSCEGFEPTVARQSIHSSELLRDMAMTLAESARKRMS
jgi:hypothetical protein